MKSPLINSLKHAFDHHRNNGARYLLVYWRGWSDDCMQLAYEPIQSGQYAWNTHDRYMAKDQNASILAIAFDLQKPFEDQMPEHLSQAQTLEGFAYRPLIHIPDRTGKIPAQEQAKQIDEALNPKPKLVLVK